MVIEKRFIFCHFVQMVYSQIYCEYSQFHYQCLKHSKSQQNAVCFKLYQCGFPPVPFVNLDVNLVPQASTTSCFASKPSCASDQVNVSSVPVTTISIPLYKVNARAASVTCSIFLSYTIAGRFNSLN